MRKSPASTKERKKSTFIEVILWIIAIFPFIKLCVISSRFISVDIFMKSLREERKIGYRTRRPASFCHKDYFPVMLKKEFIFFEIEKYFQFSV